MKHVIVTGAGRGIGLELIKILAVADYKVLALSRKTESITKLGLPNVTAFSFDLTNGEDFPKVIAFIKGYWNSKVDILINNAGVLIKKTFEELTKDDFIKVYEVNVFGVAQMIQTVIPFMDITGHVVTISSMGGIQGSLKFAGLAAYSSAKGAVITLSELLAEEYKGKGPAFNVLALGAVQTEMLAEAFPGYLAPLQANEMALYIKEFAVTGAKFYNGKILQVSSSTP